MQAPSNNLGGCVSSTLPMNRCTHEEAKRKHALRSLALLIIRLGKNGCTKLSEVVAANPHWERASETFETPAHPSLIM